MASLSAGYVFGATETVTNTKLGNLVNLASISGIVDSDISAGAAIDSTKIDLASAGYLTSGGNFDVTGLYSFNNLSWFNTGSLASIANVRIQNMVLSSLASLSDVKVSTMVLSSLASFSNLTSNLFYAGSLASITQLHSPLSYIQSLASIAAPLDYYYFVSSLASGAIPQYGGSKFVARTKAQINNALGSWSSVTVNTNIQATTDLFVVCYGDASSSLEIITDSSATPTTVRTKDSCSTGETSGGFCVVKSGDYYKVNQVAGSVTAFAIPLS